MLLTSEGITETNCSLPSKSFSIKASPIAFDILSSKLYSNPILAIVRELLTNAYDSQKAIGKEDIPITVHVPDYLDSSFSIRDYGLGLSKEDVLELYTTFFSSTKNTTNDFTGCFGLGSKTPFSYTSSFTVQSYFNGMKYYFLATKKDGYPSIICIKEEPTDEPNGLFISIPVRQYDNKQFSQTLQDYLQYIPEIKIDCNIDFSHNIKPILIKQIDNISLYKIQERYGRSDYYSNISFSEVSKAIFIKQGQNIYPVVSDLDVQKFTNIAYITTTLNNIVIEVPIGTFDITPSRESLSKTNSNLDKMIAVIEDTDRKLSNVIYDLVLDMRTNRWSNLRYASQEDIRLNTLYSKLLSVKYLSHLVHNSYFPIQEAGTVLTVDFKSLTYIHRVNQSGSFPNLEKNKKIKESEHDIILILVKHDYKAKGILALYNTINNYDELGTSDIYIGVLPDSKSLYLTNDDYLPDVRKLYKEIKIVNSIPKTEAKFNIKVMGLTKFKRLYPNSKKPRWKKISSVSSMIKSAGDKSIRCKVNSHYYNERFDTYRYNSNLTAITKSLREIFTDYPPERTIVSIINENEDYESIRKIFFSMFNICTRDKKYFMQDWILQYLSESALTANNNKFYFLQVYASNRKYFKNYTIIDVNKKLEEWKKLDWWFLDIVYDKTKFINYINKTLQTIKDLANPKIRKLILESNMYQQFLKLNNVLDKYNFDFNPDSIMQKIMQNKILNWNISNLITPNMLELCELMDDCRWMKNQKYYIRPYEKYRFYNLLSREDKKTHVLLQR